MRNLFSIAAFVALSGCATIQPVIIEKPDRLQPIKSQIGGSRSIFVSNVKTSIMDRKIGQLTGGTLCVGGQDLIWKDNQSVLNAIRETVSGTLSRNGYTVYSGLIQASAERDADILIGVGIEDIKANICYSINGKKGAASLRLKFEVLDNKTRKSFITSAAGASTILEFSPTGDPDVFTKAAEMATENLLAQEAFFKAAQQ